MDIQQIKNKKRDLGANIAQLLSTFENETKVQVSDIDFVRRVLYNEFGHEESKEYVVEVEVKL